MNPISLPPFLNHRRLGAVALFRVGLVGLVGLVTPLLTGMLLTGMSLKPAPDAKTQPIYLAYTANNIGYLYTCG